MNEKLCTIKYEYWTVDIKEASSVVINGKSHWFPKSICKICHEKKEVHAPKWLLIQKGLIK